MEKYLGAKSIMGAGIYWIHNTDNGHCYVGGSIHVDRRLREHKSLLGRGIHFNVHLQRAWDKYGAGSFELEPILSCHKDMVMWYEQQFLDQWKPEYNLSPTAGVNYGYKYSDEAKKNMSDAAIRKFQSEQGPELREAISRGSLGNKRWVGRKHTEESKAKISANRQGIGHTESTKTLIGLASRGEGNPSSKLTESQVTEIRQLRTQISGVELAKRFGVSKTTVSEIQLNKSWRHLIASGDGQKSGS